MTAVDDELLEELGFDLGWDYARFGKQPHPECHIPSVLRGFRAGRHHFGVPQHRTDRFISKWLQVRLGALKRQRRVSEDVTPSYLRAIDVTVCPVTLATLTHSTLSDTDWSVDRINNDGAYAVGNLMVISARANAAKGRKSFTEVAELSRGDPVDVSDGLTRLEWRRLACLMHGSDPAALRDVVCGPLLTRLPFGCRAPLYFLFQQMLTDYVRPAAHRNGLVKVLARFPVRLDQLHKLQLALERLAMLQRTSAYPFDALADAKVQTWIAAWYRTAVAINLDGLTRIAAGYGARECSQSLPADWAIGSHGYLRSGKALQSLPAADHGSRGMRGLTERSRGQHER